MSAYIDDVLGIPKAVRVDIERSIALHERTNKQLMDEFDVPYDVVRAIRLNMSDNDGRAER